MSELQPEGIDFAKGCVVALLIALPMWAAIAWALFGFARAIGAIDG